MPYNMRIAKTWPLLDALRSPLSWRVAFAVFIGIILIEVVVLIPSSLRKEGELLSAIEDQALTAMLGVFSSQIDDAEEELQERSHRLRDIGPILGVAVLGDDGKIFAIGQMPDLDGGVIGEDGVNRHLEEDGNTYDVAFPAGYRDLPVSVSLSLNSRSVADDIHAFVWRIIGLVLVISLFVTLVTMVVVWWILLRPMLRLESALNVQGEDWQALHVPRDLLLRRDEMGAVTRTIAFMLDKIRSSVRETEILARFPAENPNPVLRVASDGRVEYANTAARVEQTFFAEPDQKYLSEPILALVKRA
ncbi:MAG: hypothetical protein ACPGNT_01425, partial [Rhodospirillales bacterium]